MTTIHTAMATFLSQKDNTPSQASGPCGRQRGERGGRQCHGDEQVENRHPRFEDRLVLPVPEDRESQQKALRDQIRHQNVKVSQARSFSNWVSSGARSGRKEPRSQNMSAIRKSVGGPPAQAIRL